MHPSTIKIRRDMDSYLKKLEKAFEIAELEGKFFDTEHYMYENFSNKNMDPNFCANTLDPKNDYLWKEWGDEYSTYLKEQKEKNIPNHFFN